MAKRVERRTKTNAKKTPRLTYRQRVLQIYPDAEYMWGRITHRVLARGNFSNYYDTRVLSDGIYDSKESWKQAWKQVMQNMLEQFEDVDV